MDNKEEDKYSSKKEINMFEDIWETDDDVEEKVEEVGPTPTIQPKSKKTKKTPKAVPKGSGVTRPASTRPTNPPTAIIQHLVMGSNEVRLLDGASNSLLKIKYISGKYKMYAYGTREYSKDVILDAMYDWLVEIGL